jgi:hypothetical protein
MKNIRRIMCLVNSDICCSQVFSTWLEIGSADNFGYGYVNFFSQKHGKTATIQLTDEQDL